jgi:hypothetical protein
MRLLILVLMVVMLLGIPCADTDTDTDLFSIESQKMSFEDNTYKTDKTDSKELVTYVLADKRCCVNSNILRL